MLNFDNIPPFITDGKYLIRGTKEWDERERARRDVGCACISPGKIPEDGGRLVKTDPLGNWLV